MKAAVSERVTMTALRDLGIVFSVVALAIALTLSSDVFLTSRNLLNVADQWAPTAIVAVGVTIVIITGAFDLSVGATFALAGLAAVKIANETSLVLGIIAGIGVGIACGGLNALLTSVGRVNAFIATLASSIILRGVALAATGGFILGAEKLTFSNLGRNEIAGVRISIYVAAVIVLVSAFLLRRTVFGRHVYAVGGNGEAARLAGISIQKTRSIAFIISGAFAGIAGLLVASRAGSGSSQSGVGLEFTAIAAVAIGGNSIWGGQGAIWRTLLGVLLLALIGNGFNLLSINPTYQQMVQGGIIVIAVAMDAWTRRT